MVNMPLQDANKKNEANREGSAEDEARFLELRRKVREAELLSAATERLLLHLRFTGKLSLVIQNGRVLKSGYEEGYFRQPPIFELGMKQK